MRHWKAKRTCADDAEVMHDPTWASVLDAWLHVVGNGSRKIVDMKVFGLRRARIDNGVAT
jgi:hypothetical protein